MDTSQGCVYIFLFCNLVVLLYCFIQAQLQGLKPDIIGCFFPSNRGGSARARELAHAHPVAIAGGLWDRGVGIVGGGLDGGGGAAGGGALERDVQIVMDLKASLVYLFSPRGGMLRGRLT